MAANAWKEQAGDPRLRPARSVLTSSPWESLPLNGGDFKQAGGRRERSEDPRPSGDDGPRLGRTAAMRLLGGLTELTFPINASWGRATGLSFLLASAQVAADRNLPLPVVLPGRRIVATIHIGPLHFGHTIASMAKEHLSYCTSCSECAHVVGRSSCGRRMLLRQPVEHSPKSLQMRALTRPCWRQRPSSVREIPSVAQSPRGRTCPLNGERAKLCTEAVRAMLGYNMLFPFTGFVDGRDPKRLLE